MDMLGLFFLLLLSVIFIIYQKPNVAFTLGLVALILSVLLLIHHMTTTLEVQL